MYCELVCLPSPNYHLLQCCLTGLLRKVSLWLHTACRRTKAALLETDVPKLEKMIRKGKNVTKTVIDDRMAKVLAQCLSWTKLHLAFAVTSSMLFWL